MSLWVKFDEPWWLVARDIEFGTKTGQTELTVSAAVPGRSAAQGRLQQLRRVEAKTREVVQRRLVA